MEINKNIGIYQGDTCNRDGCTGTIQRRERQESCSCHINPPCGACTTPREYCDTCNWDAQDE